MVSETAESFTVSSTLLQIVLLHSQINTRICILAIRHLQSLSNLAFRQTEINLHRRVRAGDGDACARCMGLSRTVKAVFYQENATGTVPCNGGQGDAVENASTLNRFLCRLVPVGCAYEMWAAVQFEYS